MNDNIRQELIKTIQKLDDENLLAVREYIQFIQEAGEEQPTNEDLESISIGRQEYARSEFVKWGKAVFLMAFTVLLTKTALKAYNKTTGKLKLGIDRCLSHLQVNPCIGPGIKKLKGFSGCYRYQIGGLRLIYEVHEDLFEVRVYSIRPRGDVYKH